jgi:hypothetical protein
MKWWKKALLLLGLDLSIWEGLKVLQRELKREAEELQKEKKD